MTKKITPWRALATTGLIALAVPMMNAPNAFAADMRMDSKENCADHENGPGRGPRGGMRMMGDHLPPFLRSIELTEAQRDKIFELQHAQHPKQRELMKAVQYSRDAMHALSRNDSFDAVKGRSLADAHGKAVADMALNHAEMETRIRAILTPEQRKQADEQKAKQGKEWGQGRPGHHGPRAL